MKFDITGSFGPLITNLQSDFQDKKWLTYRITNEKVNIDTMSKRRLGHQN